MKNWMMAATLSLATCWVGGNSAQAQVSISVFGPGPGGLGYGGFSYGSGFGGIGYRSFRYSGVGYGVGAFVPRAYPGYGLPGFYGDYHYGVPLYRSSVTVVPRVIAPPVVVAPALPIPPVFAVPPVLGVSPLARRPVYSEPYRAARPVFPDSTLDYSESMNYPGDQALLAAAKSLQRSLERRADDADVWLDYLRPDLIISTVSEGGDPEALRGLLNNFEGLAGNAQLSEIWTTPGYRQTHQYLRQWVALNAGLPTDPSGVSQPVPSDTVPSATEPAAPQPDPPAAPQPNPAADQNQDDDGAELLPTPTEAKFIPL